MEEIVLKAQLRTKTGKESNKRLRTEGGIPAVVYKRGEGALALVLAQKDLSKALHTKAGENVVITLKIEGVSSKKEQEKTVIIKEVQHHPIRGDILHVDFNQIYL